MLFRICEVVVCTHCQLILRNKDQDHRKSSVPIDEFQNINVFWLQDDHVSIDPAYEAFFVNMRLTSSFRTIFLWSYHPYVVVGESEGKTYQKVQ